MISFIRFALSQLSSSQNLPFSRSIGSKNEFMATDILAQERYISSYFYSYSHVLRYRWSFKSTNILLLFCLYPISLIYFSFSLSIFFKETLLFVTKYRFLAGDGNTYDYTRLCRSLMLGGWVDYMKILSINSFRDCLIFLCLRLGRLSLTGVISENSRFDDIQLNILLFYKIDKIN